MGQRTMMFIGHGKRQASKLETLEELNSFNITLKTPHAWHCIT